MGVSTFKVFSTQSFYLLTKVLFSKLLYFLALKVVLLIGHQVKQSPLHRSLLKLKGEWLEQSYNQELRNKEWSKF
jgi:hypothetical protein